MLSHRPYTYSHDIWSLGVTMYQFATLKLPYQGVNVFQINHEQRMKTVAPISEVYSAELRKTIGLMMQKDPGNRPSPRAILDRPITRQWIAQLFPGESNYGDRLVASNKSREQSTSIYQRITIFDFAAAVPNNLFSILPTSNYSEPEFSWKSKSAKVE